MMFPTLKNSAFRALLNLPPALFEPSAKRPSAVYPLIAPAWPAFLDGATVDQGTDAAGAALAPLVLPERSADRASVARLLDDAAERLERLATIATDTGLNDAGRQRAAAAVVDGLLTNASGAAGAGAVGVGADIEARATRLASAIRNLPAQPAGPTAPEWRALVRSSGSTPAERWIALALLLADDNDEALPAVVEAGAGLSGLDGQRHADARLVLGPLTGPRRYVGILAEAEALDALRLARERALQAVVTAAMLPPEAGRAIHAKSGATPRFDALAALVERVEDVRRAMAAQRVPGSSEDRAPRAAETAEAA